MEMAVGVRRFGLDGAITGFAGSQEQCDWEVKCKHVKGRGNQQVFIF